MIIQNREFKVHFIGIGGVSMSWLARYFYSVGFTVSGSDKIESNTTKNLQKEGIKVFVGHNAKNVEETHVVVYSDAISQENEELKKARQLGLYVLSRIEALTMVADNFGDVVGVAGCHGKTTTTCMLAHIFKCAKIKFSAHIGGEDCVLGSFINFGSDVFLSEVCEFKRNIDKFNADYAVCLNVGKDHMDCYSDENQLIATYQNFAKRAYKSIINNDCKEYSCLKLDRKHSFSRENKGNFYCKNLTSKKGKYSFDLYREEKLLGRISLSVYGYYNVENALAASSCAMSMGIDFIHVKNGLKNFVGVKRRFEEIGNINGCQVIADYAHHPTEIQECIKTAREITKGEVYLLFQPHTYSRTVYLKEDFILALSQVKKVALFKTFSARENYIKGGSAYDLHLKIDKSVYFEDEEVAINYYKSNLKKNDLLLTLGAGDLYYLIKNELEK